ncbi:MAG: potassium/proton antiporter, partial [Acidobacteria bacterium]|nr:potassium/proton antiporter [Acidobacteriota bacterium]
IGGIEFENYPLAQTVGTLALVIILFDGGFNTSVKLFRLGFAPALRLSTLGVAVTAVLVAYFAHFVLNLPLRQGLVLGSVVSSTDAAAVFSIFQERKLNLRRRLQGVLEIESGSNDPTAVFLTLAATAWALDASQSVTGIVLQFLWQMGVGFAMGYLIGKAGFWLLSQARLPVPALYSVLALAWALVTYALADLAQASGFLAVYVAAVVLGDTRLPYHRPIARFHNAIAWLTQILMFFTLGLLSFPSRVWATVLPGISIAAFLVLVARPLSVFLTLPRTGLSWREQAFIGWVGLRGAVPVILAIYPLMRGVPDSELIFNTVIFVVFASVLVQGTTVTWVAERLGVGLPAPLEPPLEVDLVSQRVMEGEISGYRLTDSSPGAGNYIRDLTLPESALVLMILRGPRLIAPRGSVLLHPGDFVYVYSPEGEQETVRRLLVGD